MTKKFLLDHTDFLLVPFAGNDLHVFYRINTDPFVRKYLWDDQIISQETSRKILKKNEEYFSKCGYGLWKIMLEHNTDPAGYVGLWYFFDEPQPQLIYVLKEEFTGEGIATKAGRLIIDYAFSRLGFDYLTAATDEANTGSQRVAERIGMRFIEKKMVERKPTLFYRINK